MNPDEKTNRNQSQDDPPFDIDCSTETLTNEQKKTAEKQHMDVRSE